VIEKLPNRLKALLIFVLLVYLIQFSSFLFPPKNIFYPLSFIIFLIYSIFLIKRKPWSFYALALSILFLSLLSFSFCIQDVSRIYFSQGISVTTEGVLISLDVPIRAILVAIGSIATIFIYLLTLRFMLIKKDMYIPRKEVEIPIYVQCPNCGEFAIFMKEYNKYFCNECKKFVEVRGIKRTINYAQILKGFFASLLYAFLSSIAFLS